MGFYYTPNLNHIHLSVSIILSNGERVCLLPDGTRFDCREFFLSPKSEINEQCYRKLFNEFTLFPEYLREMPDALIKKVEAILFAMYIAKPSLKIKQERLSPTDEKFRSPDKKRAKTIYTPSPKSSPEPIVTSPRRKKSIIVKPSPMRVTRKKTFKVIPKQISNVPFRDLSHIAAGVFGNQNKRVQETDYESSDDEENQFHIDIYKRLGQEIGESSQVLNMDGTLGTNVNLRENQDNQKHHNWRDLIDSESSEENESHETDNLRVNMTENNHHNCIEPNCNFESGNSSGALKQHMMEKHLKGEGILCSCGMFLESKRCLQRHIEFVTDEKMRNFDRYLRRLQNDGVLSEEYRFSHTEFVFMQLDGLSPFGNRISIRRPQYEAAFMHNSDQIERGRKYVMNSRNKLSTVRFLAQ